MREAHYNAFPSPDSDGKCNPGECGLTKLEYFAGLAMQGLLASSESAIVFHVWAEGMDNTIAKIAVNHAKALLTELEKES